MIKVYVRCSYMFVVLSENNVPIQINQKAIIETVICMHSII